MDLLTTDSGGTARDVVIPRAESTIKTIPTNIIGYTFTLGGYSAWHCPSSGVWTQLKDYGRCCTKIGEDCNVFTSCVNTSVLTNGARAETCTGTGDQTLCVTGTIYEGLDQSSANLYIGCWPSWTNGNWSATRSVLEEASYIPGKGNSLPAGSIAAVVIGAILGLLLIIGTLVYILWHRKKKAKALLAKKAAEDATYPAALIPDFPLEMGPCHFGRPSEIPGDYVHRYEVNGVMSRDGSQHHSSGFGREHMVGRESTGVNENSVDGGADFHSTSGPVSLWNMHGGGDQNGNDSYGRRGSIR
ncbi:hypothetical protein BS50DRAFT_575896 [Corynespora cassiicola Philippines]|uniref:Uncharacterized protein n=1 Tax=Corynespora cassiicola Philippines TaxID=1448308 RepID=A0A2T2NGE1_CORCC|nr:hypothetical protein BS50DRAFT_575896 [Corynespora cassiicola Philippines]